MNATQIIDAVFHLKSEKNIYIYIHGYKVLRLDLFIFSILAFKKFK